MTSLFSSALQIRKIIVGLSILLSSLISSAGPVAPPDQSVKLIAQAQLRHYNLSPGQGSEIKINIHLPEGYKAYEDQFKVKILSPIDFKTSALHVSPLIEFFDKASKKIRKGAIKSGEVLVPFEVPKDISADAKEMLIELTYQVCTEKFCLFPQTLSLKTPFTLSPQTSEQKIIATDGESKSLFKLELSEVFARGLIWTFIFVFIAGVLTSFTPCIFPMIPITLSVLGRNAHTRSRWQNFMVSNLYVLGIAVTYSVMGVVAASTGALFGSFMSHPIVLSVMCLVFFAMALSMFGLYELQAPAFIQNRFSTSDDLTGYSGAFFSGIISGVVASPCVGPVLVGILTYIAKSQNLVLGFFLMFTYAVGMGQIFLVLGAFSQLTKLLPKSGPWLDGIKNIFGILMIGVCYYFLSLLLPSRAWDSALGLGFLVGAVVLIRTSFNHENRKIQISSFKLLSVVIAAVLGLSFISLGAFDLRNKLQTNWIKENPGYDIKAMNWQNYSEAAMSEAKAQNKPVIVDFNAEWCAACKELDQYTFTNQRFQLLSTQFVLMKYDATNETPELEALRSKFGIVGLPTVLFFDRQGNQIQELTLTAFEEADAFIERMSKAIKN